MLLLDNMRCARIVWLTLLSQVCRGYKNVLFISVDDLRPELGAYVDETTSPPLFADMVTPNIDRLAAKSLVLKEAHVQYPLCAPSRASVLTGRRPETTKVIGFRHYFREVGGNFTTIPQYFKEHGYTTLGFGKIFHDGNEPWNDDDPYSWSEPFMRINRTIENGKRSWKAIPDSLLDDTPLRDQGVADHAIEALQKLAPKARSGTKPFFLATGFFKPHLPFVFPKSMLKFYPKESIYMPKNMHIPYKMPELAWNPFVFLKKFPDLLALNVTGDFNTTVPEWKTLDLRRAYYSAVTFVDFQVGRVLAELERLGLSSNTVVVFWSDHGFHLGENGQWCKTTSFKMSTWAPLMFHIPGVTDSGIKSDQLVEFVDIYPTLLNATGHQLPPLCPKNSKNIKFCVEGVSVLSLADEPFKPIKAAVFSQVSRKNGTMAYTIRTTKYRYTEYVGYNFATKAPLWDNRALELYDLSIDPWENVNVAQKRKYYKIISGLSKTLRAGWRSSLLQYSYKDNTELTDAVTNEPKEGVKYKYKNTVTNKPEEEVKHKLKIELTNDLKEEVKHKLNNAETNELKDKVKRQLKNAETNELGDKVKHKLKNAVTNEPQNAVKTNIPENVIIRSSDYYVKEFVKRMSIASLCAILLLFIFIKRRKLYMFTYKICNCIHKIGKPK